MNKIEELMNIEDVQWKTLGEICNRKNGYTPSKKKREYWENGNIPWFTMADIRKNGRKLNDSLQKVNIEGVKGNLFPAGTIILSTTATIGEHAILNVDGITNQQFTCFMIKDEFKSIIDNRFLYYYFFKIDQWAIAHATKGGATASINAKLLDEVMIPIPTLEVQIEIVKILDKFTDYVNELQAELQAELQDRVNQYAYYRDYLLSEEVLNKLTLKMDVDRSIRATTLGEIGKVSMCKRILKNKTSTDGDIPFYKIGTFGKKPDAFINRGLYEEYREKYSYPKKGDVLLSASGTIGKEVMYDGEDAYYQDSNIIWIANDEKIVKNKYLYYFYQTEPWKATTGGTIARLYGSTLSQTNITVPSLEVQDIVIKILDKFQSLIEDTKGLLPEEIEQRQKQYEYYRDKLLTFEPEYSSKQITDGYIELLFEAAKLVDISIRCVKYQNFGEIADIRRGASPRPISKHLTTEDNGVPWIKIGDVDKNGKYITHTKEKITVEGSHKSRLVHDGDFVMSNSMSYGRPYIVKIDGAIHDGWASISDFSNYVIPDFLYYYLTTNKVNDYWDKKINSSSVSNLNIAIISSLSMPVVSKKVQKYVVSHLDKFNQLISGIEDSLPREIELRQKQYEYYRDKLLDFLK